MPFCFVMAKHKEALEGDRLDQPDEARTSRSHDP
jgi:hypothetical protein